MIYYYESTNRYITIFNVFTIEPSVNSDPQLINGGPDLYHILIKYDPILTSMTKQY